LCQPGNRKGRTYSRPSQINACEEVPLVTAFAEIREQSRDSDLFSF